MDNVVKMLIGRLGVDATESHINACISIRRGASHPVDAELDILSYLAKWLGHILTADEAVAWVQSIMRLDAGVASVTL